MRIFASTAVTVARSSLASHLFKPSRSQVLRVPTRCRLSDENSRGKCGVSEEIARHSTIQSTMNVYTQAMPEGKRAANSVVVQSVLPFESCGGVTVLSGGREWE